jgi:type I restriction enzyme, S subunit
MKTQKLGEFIDKWHIKKDDWRGSKKLDVLGVSNVDGITATSHKKSKDLSKYLVIEPNCFAYNPYRINVGSIGLTPEESYGLVSPAYTVFKVKENKLIPELLLDFLKSFDGLQQINKYARGTVRKALRYDDLCEIEVNFPVYEEQKKIFKKKLLIETEQIKLSDEILTQKQLITQLKQAILQDAVQGKLTKEWRKQNPSVKPASELLERIKAEKKELIKDKKIKKEKPLSPITKEEIPFEIPDSWSWCRLGEITHTITKGSSPKWQGVQYVEEGVLFITSENVGTSEILLNKKKFVQEKFNEIEPRSILKKGDILTNIVGASIGRTAIWDKDEIANINQAVCLVRFPEEYFNKELLVNTLNSDFGIELMMDGQFDTGRGNLSLGAVSKFKIPFPPKEEQKAIVEKVETLMQKCDELELEIKQSEENVNMLMQAVLKEASQN